MHPIPFPFLVIAVDAATMGLLEVAYTPDGMVYGVPNTPFLGKNINYSLRHLLISGKMLHSQNLTNVFLKLLVRFACAQNLLLLLISCFHWWFWTRNCKFNFLCIKYIFLLLEIWSNFCSLFYLFTEVYGSAILFQQMMMQHFLFVGGQGKTGIFSPEIAYLQRKC